MKERVPDLSEKQISEQIKDYLNLKHIPFWRMNTGVASYTNPSGKQYHVQYGERGMPDFLLALKVKDAWHIAFCEVKTRRGKLSPNQEWFKQYAQQQGICYVLARSVDDLEQGIEEYRKRFR
jgi:hypothetical protein